VYFFASPHITRNVGPWDDALFSSFAQIYVGAFAALVQRTLATRSSHDPPVRFFYPSSVFLTHPETGFTEYAAAKAAGEALCDQLGARQRARFFKPRLPRLSTDQTSSFADIGAADPLPVMMDAIRNFHSGGGVEKR
jgi:hypothetical protein